MKKSVFILLALLLGMTATAQTQKQKLTITTKRGKVHTYVMGESMDSLRILNDVGITNPLLPPTHRAKTPTVTPLPT